MEEILELKELLLKGDINTSLTLVNELEEMGRKDIISNIRSYAIILLLNLIKQQVENRSTRSWDVSIRNSVLEIQDLNERPKSKGVYLNTEELNQILEKAYLPAINKASLEVEEGRYDSRELEQKVDRVEILNQAMNLMNAD
ncbi:MAG: DUF29 family protein [Cyanobacteria bacterium J06592_8]